MTAYEYWQLLSNAGPALVLIGLALFASWHLVRTRDDDWTDGTT